MMVLPGAYTVKLTVDGKAYTQPLLIVPDPRVHVQTLETILAHCAQHPTVYLPSHDPESAPRLAGSVTVG